MKKLAVVAAFVCIGAGVMGTGIAHAAPPKYVFSDKITAAGNLVAGTTKFTLAKCSLTSDGELKPYACKLTGNLVRNSTGSSLGIVVHSADGTISSFQLPLTPTSANTNSFNGKVTEKDAPEKGVVPPPYPAIVSGTVKIVGTAVTITATVSELSTQP